MPEFIPYKNMLHLNSSAHDKVCQLPTQGGWFSSFATASFSNTDHHMTEILLKVGLNPNQTISLKSVSVNVKKSFTVLQGPAWKDLTDKQKEVKVKFRPFRV